MARPVVLVTTAAMASAPRLSPRYWLKPAAALSNQAAVGSLRSSRCTLATAA